MSSFDGFDATLAKMLTGTALVEMQDLVAQLRSKGLGEMPVDSQLARHGSTSASATSDGSPLKRSGSKRAAPRSGASPGRGGSVSEATQHQMEDAIKAMVASDWSVRDTGISSLEELVETAPDFVVLHANRVFDAFMPRLTDVNSKVNMHALVALRQVVPTLGPGLDPLATQIVPQLAQNLASKTASIRETATQTLQLMIEHLDPAVLAQPYCAAAEFGNSKVMEAMVPVVCDLVLRLHPNGTKLLVKHAVPLQMKLLNEAKGGLRTACQNLCRALHQTMGPEFLASVPAAHRATLQAMAA